jgi:hypothetical protein
MRAQMPRFLAHLKRVRGERAVLRRWGKCVNVDEFSGTEIVAPRILEMLGRQTGADMKPPALHAGVQHTYGYLLSLTPTPFGFKRSRWLQPTIEAGFDLPPGSLQAFPRRGTLLTNLTDFLSQLALREQRSLKILGPHPVSTSWSPSGVSGWRVRETITTERSTEVVLQIDLIPFIHPPRAGQCALLVYSMSVNNQPVRLITTFPIDDAMLTEMLELPRGRRVEIRPRFNAHVSDLGNQPLPGRRSIEEWSIP